MKKFIIKYAVLTLIFIFSVFGCSISDSALTAVLKKGIDADVLDEVEYEPETVSLPQPQKRWTIMVYLAADNNPFNNLDGASVADVNEMLKAGGSSDNFNLVVFWDQSNTLYGNRHGYYYIGNREAILVNDTGEINMGDPEVAKSFINYSLLNFPADHFMFIFWDHGDGVDKSFSLSLDGINKKVCEDVTGGTDYLNDFEQVDIISHFDSSISRNVDIVAYDACLMGMAEIMYQIRDYSDYFIASEDNVPGYGFNYNFIKAIDNNPAITSEELGSTIVDYYESFYTTTFPNNSVTLSCINQSRMIYLELNIKDFVFDAIASGNKSLFRISSYNTASPYAYPIQYYPNNDASYDYFDLYSYMIAISSNVSMPVDVKSHADSIIALIQPVGGIIVNEYHGSMHDNRSYGISVYIETSSYTNGSVYDINPFSVGTDWGDFLYWINN